MVTHRKAVEISVQQKNIVVATKIMFKMLNFTEKGVFSDAIHILYMLQDALHLRGFWNAVLIKNSTASL